MRRKKYIISFGEALQDFQVDLEEALDKLDLIIINQEKLMATIAQLQEAVTRNTTVEDSLLTLLQGIVQQLKDAIASGDPAALDAVVAQIDASTQKLTDAVVANTPVPSA